MRFSKSRNKTLSKIRELLEEDKMETEKERRANEKVKEEHMKKWQRKR